MMKGLKDSGPLFAKLKVTEEKIKNQIYELGKKIKVDRPEDMFDYKLYYYPFHVMRIKGELKRRLFNDLYKQTFISLDAIEGYYAVASIMSEDKFFDRDIDDRLQLGAVKFQPLIEKEEAFEIGVENLRRSNAFSFRTSFWLNSRVEIIPLEYRLVYKPFWKVKITNDEGSFIRIIDGTTGEVGGNNGYRFLKGYERILEGGY